MSCGVKAKASSLETFLLTSSAKVKGCLIPWSLFSGLQFCHQDVCDTLTLKLLCGIFPFAIYLLSSVNSKVLLLKILVEEYWFSPMPCCYCVSSWSDQLVRLISQTPVWEMRHDMYLPEFKARWSLELPQPDGAPVVGQKAVMVPWKPPASTLHSSGVRHTFGVSLFSLTKEEGWQKKIPHYSVEKMPVISMSLYLLFTLLWWLIVLLSCMHEMARHQWQNDIGNNTWLISMYC